MCWMIHEQQGEPILYPFHRSENWVLGRWCIFLQGPKGSKWRHLGFLTLNMEFLLFHIPLGYILRMGWGRTPLSCLQNWGRRVLSLVWLFTTTCTVACQAPLSVHGVFQARVGYHFLLQEIFPTQGSNPRFQHCQADSLPLSHHRSPGSRQTTHVKTESNGWGMLILPCSVFLLLPRPRVTRPLYYNNIVSRRLRELLGGLISIDRAKWETHPTFKSQ